MITSRQNQRLKDIRRLRRSKGDRTRVLLEGPHLVAEAIAAGLEIETVLATPGFLATPEGDRLGRALPSAPLEVAPELFEDLTDADSPRGILAVARLPRSGAEALPLREGGVYLYLDGLQDPGNLGALARVAEAAGAAGLALSPGTAHPNHPRALRASAGSLLRLPVAVETGPDALDRQLAPLRPRWAALAPRGGESLWTRSLPRHAGPRRGRRGPRPLPRSPGARRPPPHHPDRAAGRVAQRHGGRGAGPLRGPAAPAPGSRTMI